MMVSEALKSYAKEQYALRLPLLGMCRQEVESRMVECTEEEQVLMQFLYGTMPLRDAGEYDFSVFLGFVRHALMLRETMEWCRDISEEMFLHYILYYRINTEAIEDCRPFFYGQLIERIKGMTACEAVLEINYWCAEHASYALTDDRTVSPMTVYRSGNGRCGEESTFAVTAFRSVGIPARQVYTPRWAHCDDNHAWAEVYVEGGWHFLGACEPEEVLDRGWFTNASSRALLVHTRTFSDYPVGQEEEFLGREGMMSIYNQTAAYALTRRYEIVVLNGRLRPVPGARISIELLNMAEYSSIACVCTDHEGRAVLSLGLGDIHIVAEKGGRWAEMITSVKHTERTVLVLNENGLGLKEVWADMDMEAPAASMINSIRPTKEQQQKNRSRISMGNQIRKARLNAFFHEEHAALYPQVRAMLLASGENFSELYRFLSKDNHPDRQTLMSLLSIKDAKDAKAEILEGHLCGAEEFRGSWESRGQIEIYFQYILCPRIYLEELSDYRGFIRKYFYEEEQWKFREDPERIWTFIQSSIRYDKDEDYDSLISSPAGCLQLLWGSPLSQKILFVAICRTLGIPARINPANREAEWLKDGQFKCLPSLSQNQSASVLWQPGELKLLGQNERWAYNQNWTLGKLKDGHFVTLDYTDAEFTDDVLTLILNAGTYRLLTSARLPNGNQKASEYIFDLRPGEKKQVSMRLRAGKPEDMLTNNLIEDFFVTLPDKKSSLVSSLLKEKPGILILLAPGEEPSEHILNELLARKQEFRARNLRTILILSDKEQGLSICREAQESSEHREEQTSSVLRQVLQEIPQIQAAYADMEAVAEPLARQLYIDSGKFPILALTTFGLKAVYACSGYNVGSIGLILKLLAFLS